jgi:hypothetical protein
VLGLLTPIARLFMKTPEQGAATPVYLASSPQVEGVNGAYFASPSVPPNGHTTPTSPRNCGR